MPKHTTGIDHLYKTKLQKMLEAGKIDLSSISGILYARKELTFESCPLMSTCMLRHVYVYLHDYDTLYTKHTINNDDDDDDKILKNIKPARWLSE